MITLKAILDKKVDRVTSEALFESDFINYGVPHHVQIIPS